MFTNVHQCFPLFSNVHQCSPRFPLKFPLAGSPQVFKCFFFFFVFFFTQCHISLSHFYGHNRFWERGAIFQSESKKISQVTRWSLHLRSHHTSIVVWKKNTVIVGRTFSGQISLKNVLNSLSSAFNERIWKFFVYLVSSCSCVGAFQIPATVWVHLNHSVAACYCVVAVGAPYCYAVLWVHYKFLLLWVYFQCLVPPAISPLLFQCLVPSCYAAVGAFQITPHYPAGKWTGQTI